MNERSTGILDGYPSRTPPTATPCDSPNVVRTRCLPMELPVMRLRLAPEKLEFGFHHLQIRFGFVDLFFELGLQDGCILGFGEEPDIIFPEVDVVSQLGDLTGQDLLFAEDELS